MGTISQTKISKLTKALNDAKDAMKRDGKAAFKEALKDVFDTNPQLKAIRWHQYTPYFNDGETCTFRLGQFYVKMKPGFGPPSEYSDDTQLEIDVDSDDEDHDDDFVEAELWTWAPPGQPKPVYCDEFKAAVEAAKEIERVSDELFLMTFGDHVTVTANRRGFSIAEYDHE